MTIVKRFSLALVFALLMAGVTFVFAQAGTAVKAPAQQTQTLECFMCHPQFDAAWKSGAHGTALSDSRFNQMWTDQGKPGACLVCHVTGYDPATAAWKADGVTCDNCHSPAPAGHAMDPVANPVPVDRTTDLCGRCHSGSHFDVGAWQTSTHFQLGMSCTVCHDPHSATLKTVTGYEDDGPSGLCINCHREVSMNFPYSKHNQAGVSCVDCHLLHFTPQSDQDVHSMPDHSFTASLLTCNSCHASQMHAVTTETPGTTSSPAEVEVPATTETVEGVEPNPSPVSPLGYAGLASLLGLAGGMVLSPWLERLYRKLNEKKGGKK